MKLIADIIQELIDIEKPITSPLLKTKFLASRIDNIELLNWVSNELSGYSNNEDVPKYRKCIGNIRGTFTNGNTRYTNANVPISGFDDDFRNTLSMFYFTQSIENVESMSKMDKIIKFNFPAEIVGLIGEEWRKMGNPYLNLISCERFISNNFTKDIVSKVRDMLLDFMLEIDKNFGNITEIETLKNSKEEITKIMTQKIILSGDGNIINTGNNTSISAKINISKQNKDDLQRILQENNVSIEDISELMEIIDTDGERIESNGFGSKVKNWFKNMFSKSLDGTISITTSVISGVLTEAVNHYYGLNS